jgi:hypothetical protein
MASGLAAPSLGPLASFTGAFRGSGFNLIFRPDSTLTPTPLPIPVSGSDNVLELNLTRESLSFSQRLGSVPNRGSNGQRAIFLNGVGLRSVPAGSAGYGDPRTLWRSQERRDCGQGGYRYQPG